MGSLIGAGLGQAGTARKRPQQHCYQRRSNDCLPGAIRSNRKQFQADGYVTAVTNCADNSASCHTFVSKRRCKGQDCLQRPYTRALCG